MGPGNNYSESIHTNVHNRLKQSETETRIFKAAVRYLYIYLNQR